MGLPWSGVVYVAGLLFLLGSSAQLGPFKWMGYDNFDIINDRMDEVNLENCRSKPSSALTLPAEAVAQLPRFNKLLSTIIYPNRTNLLHLHNMALNRAFFYSYIYQKLNYTNDFYSQPGLMYYYFSAVSDITANEYNINGSALFFDTNTSYPNWYRNLPFNKTLPLFGPRAWRYDDYNEPTNWLREPTNHTVDVVDYGAGPQHNYTTESYKINEWYYKWLPDGWDKQELDSVRKHSYDVGIKYSNATGKFTDDEFKGKVFFGPPSPGQKETKWLPVVFTAPYFDCGRSNRWIISAVSPVVDQLPRYLDWFHLRRHQFVGVSVMDQEFLSIDMNQCPLGIGNEPPNYFHNTARCKPSTMCEPLYGWGFRRGGYHCMCKPGYRLPPWQNGPYLGIEIESATENEYKAGFDCIPVELQNVIPLIRGNESMGTPQYNAVGRKKREASGPGVQPMRLNVIATPNRQRRSLRPAGRKAHVEKRSISSLASDLIPRRTSTVVSNMQSTILNKKQRLYRMMELIEKEVKDTRGKLKRKVVPRYNHQPLISRIREEFGQVKERKKRFVPRYPRNSEEIRRRRKKRSTYDQNAYDRMMDIFNRKESVNKDNCFLKNPEQLELPGDVAYGAEKVFSPQARTALRLSHFLSNFLQNIDMYEEYGNLRGDKLLNIEQIFGEVIANVMGDLKIKASGVFYDVDKYRGPDGRTRQFFGPYAFRYEKDKEGGPEGDRANTHFRAVDFAGLPTHYLDQPWFKYVKERWQSNTYGLDKFTQRPLIRSDLQGTSLKKFELYPMYFYAPREQDGWWSPPYFDCSSYVNDWIISYSVPFFGLNSIGTAIEFKGVVRVDMKLDELDLNQCPQDFHVANAFKDTARCHFDSSYCVHLPGKKFVRGAYKCECLPAFEYPYEDRAWYFDGQTMEEEYRKLMLGYTNRYETLRCRISGASQVAFSWLLLVLVSIATWLK